MKLSPGGSWTEVKLRTRVVFALVGLCFACSSGDVQQGPAADLEPTLILLSLDGFRWDYLDKVDTPNLRRLAAEGVRAEGLIPVFPSKTFPSHYSIVTGLYPGRHGIWSNTMRDPELGEFNLGLRSAVEDGRWWDGEPIWVSAEKQGLRSAILFWPGSEAEIGGVRPSDWRKFDSSLPFADRVTEVLGWLDRPAAERPRLIAFYMEEPNDTSHDLGPEATETFAAVRQVDARVGDLLTGLEQRGLRDKVNLMIVADHGMAEVSPERVVVLDDYALLEDGEVFEQGALLQIFPGEGREQLVYDALVGAHPHLAVYLRDEIPERFGLRGSSRLPPILGAPAVGWEVYTRSHFESVRDTMLRGDHGQDPQDERMHGLFIAAGPAFHRGLRIGRIENVQLYNLMAAVLDLEPAPNDGDPEALRHLLADSP